MRAITETLAIQAMGFAVLRADCIAEAHYQSRIHHWYSAEKEIEKAHQWENQCVQFAEALMIRIEMESLEKERK